MPKITIPLNFWGQNCMGKCVNLSLYVVYFKCYATFYIIVLIFRVPVGCSKGLKMKPLGHYFSLVPGRF